MAATRGPTRGTKRPTMSMLVFYINRAGTKLSPSRRRVLERAKSELGRLYGN